LRILTGAVSRLPNTPNRDADCLRAALTMVGLELEHWPDSVGANAMNTLAGMVIAISFIMIRGSPPGG